MCSYIAHDYFLVWLRSRKDAPQAYDLELESDVMDAHITSHAGTRSASARPRRPASVTYIAVAAAIVLVGDTSQDVPASFGVVAGEHVEHAAGHVAARRDPAARARPPRRVRRLPRGTPLMP